MPCYCYATKTHIRTTRSLISQPSSAVKGADKSEQQSHHSMFEQIKLVDHTRTTVHDHPQLSLKCRQPNRISFDVFHRCFCKVATRVCETLLSCIARLGASRSRLCPGPRAHLIRPCMRAMNLGAQAFYSAKCIFVQHLHFHQAKNVPKNVLHFC